MPKELSLLSFMFNYWSNQPMGSCHLFPYNLVSSKKKDVLGQVESYDYVKSP